MGIRSEKPIYQILEQKLKETAKPVTCVALMEDSSVRKAALAEYGEDIRVATNKLSDALGLMWRRGLLIKQPSPQGRQLIGALCVHLGQEEGHDYSHPCAIPVSS